jgi:hypothetical protein
MIRKQLYLEPQQQQKLKRIASRRGWTEAEVVRRAIDQLPEPGASLDDLVVERLAAAGMLVPPPDDDIPTESEAEEMERELDAWLAERCEPLGLSEAVWQDREGR